MTADTDPVLDPEGDHDAEALKEAAERMHVKTDGEEATDPDPQGDHDPQALKDAAEKMNTEP